MIKSNNPQGAAPEQVPSPQASPQAAPQAAPVHEPPPPQLDDLSSLLSQFEAETAPKPTPQATAQPAQQQQQPAQQQLDDLEALLKQAESQDPTARHEAITRANEAYKQALASGASAESLKAQLGIVTQGLRAMQAHQQWQLDNRDFDRFVTQADQMLKDNGVAVGSEFARRYIASEAASNPALREAFDTRHNSKGHLRRFERMATKMELQLLRAAKAEPDQAVTADRYMVAAAVRGTGSAPPPRPPVKYGDLNEADFRKELGKYGL